MESIFMVAGILLALIAALLAIPLSMSFYLTSNRQLHGYAQVRWLFGAVNFKSHFPGKENSTLRKNLKTDIESLAEKNKPIKHKSDRNTGFSLLKQSKFRRHLIRFIKKILRASHAQDLYLRLRIGLGDPADTGLLWAFMGPITGMLYNLHRITIELEADYIDPVMEVESHGHFQIIPLQLIFLILLFVLSPTTQRAWYTMQKENR